MLDPAIAARLDERGVRWCLIGAVAMAAHGWARYSADVDLLTMDRQVLEPSFWAGVGDGEFRVNEPEIRVGNPDDPLGGVVRFHAYPPHDVVVGRGYVADLD